MGFMDGKSYSEHELNQAISAAHAKNATSRQVDVLIWASEHPGRDGNRAKEALYKNGKV